MFSCQQPDLNVVSGNSRKAQAIEQAIDQDNLCAFVEQPAIELKIFRRKRGSHDEAVCSGKQRFNLVHLLLRIFISVADQVLVTLGSRMRLHTTTDL